MKNMKFVILLLAICGLVLNSDADLMRNGLTRRLGSENTVGKQTFYIRSNKNTTFDSTKSFFNPNYFKSTGRDGFYLDDVIISNTDYENNECYVGISKSYNNTSITEEYFLERYDGKWYDEDGTIISPYTVRFSNNERLVYFEYVNDSGEENVATISSIGEKRNWYNYVLLPPYRSHKYYGCTWSIFPKEFKLSKIKLYQIDNGVTNLCNNTQFTLRLYENDFVKWQQLGYPNYSSWYRDIIICKIDSSGNYFWFELDLHENVRRKITSPEKYVLKKTNCIELYVSTSGDEINNKIFILTE